MPATAVGTSAIAAHAEIRRMSSFCRVEISAWAAIALVPTAVAGIYGMNFEHMPELKWRVGYPLAITVIVGICLVLYRNFRRNHWL